MAVDDDGGCCDEGDGGRGFSPSSRYFFNSQPIMSSGAHPHRLGAEIYTTPRDHS